MARIVQMSDLHIAVSGELFHEMDTRERFHRVLKHAALQKQDLLVLSGDLCATEGDRATYRWIGEQVNSLPCEKIFMAGNHDDSRLLAEELQLTGHLRDGLLYGRRDFAGHAIYYADTSTDELADSQMRWLRSTLKQEQQKVLFFMHHPPVNCHCAFMDRKYPLRNRDEVWPKLYETTKVKHVFCGHYHVEKEINFDDARIYLTPSLAMLIRADRNSFCMQDVGPGYREIIIDGESLSTHCHYPA